MGELLNIQERYVFFEGVPESLGFLSAEVKYSNTLGMMFLHEGEVLTDKHGKGTYQTRPEVYA